MERCKKEVRLYATDYGIGDQVAVDVKQGIMGGEKRSGDQGL